MPTPLYDALKEYIKGDPLRFHMPGHKGKLLPASELMRLAAIDVTELSPTGNLYEAGGPFDEAQRLWAEIFGFEFCQFLTGGSTMGIHTGLALCAKPGERVLIDRNCHRAVFNALALLDLEPVWLERPWLSAENLIGPISPEMVEKKLDLCPDIKTICITSPTYTGVLSDIEGIAAAVHGHGGKLFVDGAHGAHLPFLEIASYSGADAVAVSAHPMMASLDLSRQWLRDGGEEEYRRAARRAVRLRERFPALSARGGLSLDPCRFVLNVKDGPAFVRALEKRGVYPEMEDGGHVVFICTAQDSDGDFDRLEETLEQLRDQMGERDAIPAPPVPERVSSPRQALFAHSRMLPLAGCEGEVAACQIAPYPPGVPVVAPGERISKKELAYLEKIGYNMHSEIRTVVL